MEPFLKEGTIILVNRLSYLLSKPNIDDVVIIKKFSVKEKDYVVKRITNIKNEKYYVMGDNKEESTDSRDFGWIEKKDIIGKVIFI